MEDRSEPYEIKTAFEKKVDQKREIIKADIEKINAALDRRNYDRLRSVHRYIDGKYQACIARWNEGAYGFVPEYGFNYEVLDIVSMEHNLELMKAKLEAFIDGWNVVENASNDMPIIPDININSTTNVNITISFEQVREKIEDMTALSREQTDEAIEKVNELEAISKENISRKSKWEKVKPIIAFAMDKGADLGIAILTLIVQMKLGV